MKRVSFTASLFCCLLATTAAASSPAADPGVAAQDLDLTPPQVKLSREVLALDTLLDARNAAEAKLEKGLAELDAAIATLEGHLADPRLENRGELEAAVAANKATRAKVIAQLEQVRAAKKDIEAKLKTRVGVLEIPTHVDYEGAVAECREHAGEHLWFALQVQPKGRWDFKQYHRKYENFGNFFYGYVGLAAGMSKEKLLRMAGVVQVWKGTSNEEWGKPGNDPPYGDDPIDQYWIKRGIEKYEKETRPK